MTKKIIAFGASNSKNSINKKFAHYVGSLLQGVEVKYLDLNDFEAPLFSVDIEKENGIPQAAIQLQKEIDEADGVVISFAEHNGNITAAFKSIYDWMSRIDGNVWKETPLFTVATSPGQRGGLNALNIILDRYKFKKYHVAAHYSLPSFNENFDNGITDEGLLEDLMIQVEEFMNKI